MKKQVLLWVILSVTLLVILILGAGLCLLRDKQTVPVAEVAKEPRLQFDAFEITNKNNPLPGMEYPPVEKQEPANSFIEKQDVAIGQTAESETKSIAEKTAPSETSSPRKLSSASAAAKETAPKKTIQGIPKPGKHYWIQTGSYKSKSKADSCNAVIIENGLSGRISTKTLDDGTYFRVRIGPYSNKNEAEKFLTWIKKIDGFEESYISLEIPAKR